MPANILAQTACPHHYHITALQSPEIATTAKPGQHILIERDLKLPIMRTYRFAGRVDILYAVTPITLSLSQLTPDQEVPLEGPLGQAVTTPFQRSHILVLSEGPGLAAALFLADHLRQTSLPVTPLFLLGAETGFPFQPRPSSRLLPDMSASVIAAAPLLEDWGYTSRLASYQELPGCFAGTVTELAARYLDVLDVATLACYEIVAMLSSEEQRHQLRTLAMWYALPLQLC